MYKIKKKIFVIFCKFQRTFYGFMQIYTKTDWRCKLEPICIFVLYSVLLFPHFHVANYSDKVKGILNTNTSFHRIERVIFIHIFLSIRSHNLCTKFSAICTSEKFRRFINSNIYFLLTGIYFPFTKILFIFVFNLNLDDTTRIAGDPGQLHERNFFLHVLLVP